MKKIISILMIVLISILSCGCGSIDSIEIDTKPIETRVVDANSVQVVLKNESMPIMLTEDIINKIRACSDCNEYKSAEGSYLAPTLGVILKKMKKDNLNYWNERLAIDFDNKTFEIN